MNKAKLKILTIQFENNIHQVKKKITCARKKDKLTKLHKKQLKMPFFYQKTKVKSIGTNFNKY